MSVIAVCCALQEVTKKSGGKKGKGKGCKGKDRAGDEPAAAAGKAKYKSCSSFFQFFQPDTSSSKQAVHPSMLPFTQEDDEEDEVCLGV